MNLPVTSVFNDGYIAELYEQFKRDPSSVDDSWRQYFRFAEQLTGSAPATAGGADPDLLRRVAAAAGLVSAIQRYGHMCVQIDPLGSPPTGAAEMKPEFHGITEAELGQIPAKRSAARAAPARTSSSACGSCGAGRSDSSTTISRRTGSASGSVRRSSRSDSRRR
jgi:2-oxoglutarate dehydrogenase complex dehydrogenase (E1) component-like enzyme